jgi:hypothetical protein
MSLGCGAAGNDQGKTLLVITNNLAKVCGNGEGICGLDAGEAQRIMWRRTCLLARCRAYGTQVSRVAGVEPRGFSQGD